MPGDREGWGVTLHLPQLLSWDGKQVSADQEGFEYQLDTGFTNTNRMSQGFRENLIFKDVKYSVWHLSVRFRKRYVDIQVIERQGGGDGRLTGLHLGDVYEVIFWGWRQHFPIVAETQRPHWPVQPGGKGQAGKNWLKVCSERKPFESSLLSSTSLNHFSHIKTPW